MCNSAYLVSEYPPSLISEKSPLKDYDVTAGRLNWTDGEIAAIRSVLKRLTSIRILNSNDAEDLVQDTLVTMLTKHPGMTLEKGPLAWSLGILRRKVGNYYRRAQRHASLDEKEIINRPAMQAASPEGRVLHEELAALVHSVLPGIPPAQRQALELLISGLTAREITEALRPASYQNVITRLHRGRKKLVSVLSRYGYGPDAAAGLHTMKRTGGKRRPREGKSERTA